MLRDVGNKRDPPTLCDMYLLDLVGRQAQHVLNGETAEKDA
jgi:hypothetical protein